MGCCYKLETTVGRRDGPAIKAAFMAHMAATIPMLVYL
jgi:hypothetical protein